MDINKTRVLKECDTWHFWYFKATGFNIHGTDYHCIISKISKGKVIKVTKTMKNTNLTKKAEHYKT